MRVAWAAKHKWRDAKQIAAGGSGLIHTTFPTSLFLRPLEGIYGNAQNTQTAEENI